MVREIASQTLMIQAHITKPLSSMFHLRGHFCCAKDLFFLAVFLCAISILVLGDGCSLNEAERQLEIDRCKPYIGNSDTNSPRLFDGDAGLLASRDSRRTIEHQGREIICPDPNLFCFLSTLDGFSFNEVGPESEEIEAYEVQSEGFPSGLKQERSNLSWPTKHGIFRTFAGRVISCSSNQLDGFHGSASIYNNDNGEKVNASSYMSMIFDPGTHVPKSAENAEIVNSDGVSGPPVEIKPFLLDWGKKHLYYPSVAFLTVKNVHSESVLTIYHPYSSNSQFNPCNFSEILLAPGEMESICFTFIPRKLGLSSAQIVLQTSFGGFLIQAKGFAVDSPYFTEPLEGFNISSSGRWRKNLSVFNPFNEALHVEQITAWMSTPSGNTSCLSKAICSIHSMEDSSEEGMLSTKKWLDFGSADDCQPEISIRPHKNWEITSQRTEAVVELDVSDHFEGKIVGGFCLQLVRSSVNGIETVVVPLEAELRLNSALDTDYISVSLEDLAPSDTSLPVVALSVRNDGPYILSVIKLTKIGGGAENFQVKFFEGLVLFPRSVTQVAIVSYLRIHEVDVSCRFVVQINDTRNSQIEISCVDVVSTFSRNKLDSTIRYTQENDINVSYVKGGESLSGNMHPPTDVKAVDRREADEVVLKNWKSQARASFMSVLDKNEVLFPMVEVGNHCADWIAIKNPSNRPILVQLILNSGEIIDNCRTSEMHLQTSSSSILAGNKSIAPAKYGFSVAKDALTEALIHPYETAWFGPILFQPSLRCEWRSSALVRNNLSGVEWLSLRGFGGLISLVLLEGSDPVRSLEFQMNSPSQLSFSSPETLHSVEGKKPLCSHPLTKEVYAKNTGDFPLEVLRIGVSGSDCGLDGFLVLNCKGFTLPPGESALLQISYQSDFSAATIQRDLELSLATGILMIPMRASLPMLLHNFCKRSNFWMRVKKNMFLIVFAVSMLFFLVHLLLPRSTAFAFDDLKSGKSKYVGSGAVNYLSMRLKWRTSAAMPPKMDGFGKSLVGEEEALLFRSDDRKGDVNASEHRKHENSSMDDLPETVLPSPELSNLSSQVENSDLQGESDSRILSVRVGKEKGRRRRKKKNSGMKLPGIFDVSSSQSSNSTPTSPLSPATSLTPKRSWLVPLDMEQPVEIGNPFSEKRDKRECSEPPKIDMLKDDFPKQNLARKHAGRAVLLPSATFPSAGRPAFLTSTSTISPQARAPGTKLHNQKTGESGVSMDVEEKFTYDIWGDHIFRLPVAYQSNRASNVPFRPLENNSESFFVRDPQTLMTNSLLIPVSSDPEEGNNK